MKSDTSPTSTRRRFLTSLAALPVGLAATTPTSAAQAEAPKPDPLPPLPRRKLGRNGPEVTMLTMGGTMEIIDSDFFEHCWNLGIRSIDLADCYLKSTAEQRFAKWLAEHPERRPEIFLVTKDHPVKGIAQMPEQLDRRLEACGTDYIDLFFIHQLGPAEYGQDSMNWPRSDEFRQMCDRLKESGKARMVGFSCHDRDLLPLLHAAAEGGFVDAIMLRYDVFFERGGDFDRAVQACYDAGIGLIAMKEMRAAKNAPRLIPEIEPLGLTAHQGVLFQVWSDSRISAVCSAMDSREIVVENTAAARKFDGPLPSSISTALREAVQKSAVGFCPGCPACLSSPMAYAYDDVSRFLAYYEQDANPAARDLFRSLPASRREFSPAELEALRDRCAYHVDYPEIARRAHRLFA